jgi:hypothetical protein
MARIVTPKHNIIRYASLRQLPRGNRQKPTKADLFFFKAGCVIIDRRDIEKAKPVVRQGRKAMGLMQIARLPISMYVPALIHLFHLFRLQKEEIYV